MTSGVPRTASARVPHDVASVAEVRHALSRSLHAHGVGQDRVDDALLVMSELLSNAIKHARPLPDGRVAVAWSVGPDRLELSVTDGGSATVPVADVATLAAIGGRGLDIVRQLSLGWGVDRGRRQVTVWAALPATARVLVAR